MAQAMHPITLYNVNLALSILTIPATIGAKVLMIGKNLAKTIAPPPCFS
jgi:hypothetical protein